MLKEPRQHDFCWTCHKKIHIPEGYNPKVHKLVCSPECKTIEQLFTQLHSDDTQRALCMHQEWVKQTKGT